jgi:hypothetical protein
MKKVLLLTSVLLALTAAVALAGGVNFNWGTVCYTEAPVSVMTFACNVNTGSWNMTASFISDQEITDFVGFEETLAAQSDQTALPDWWKLGVAPDCRASKANFFADFSTAPQTQCFDWAGGFATVAYIPSSYTWNGNTVHILTGAAIGADTPFDLLPGTQYYAGKLTISNSKAAGTGACAGCSAGMYWCVPLITAAGLGGTRVDEIAAIPGGNQCLIWNNYIVASRNTTWGQVKSLYR